MQPCVPALSDPARLQELADSPTARDLVTCGQKWLTTLTPLFNRKGTQPRRLPASIVFRSGRALR
jgi:hypothetical protein